MHYVLKRVLHERRVTVSVWIAFYFTVPLAIYDWLYCGVYLGFGMDFLWRFWYLTTYYVISWPLLPGMAAILNRTERARPGHVGCHPTTRSTRTRGRTPRAN